MRSVRRHNGGNEMSNSGVADEKRRSLLVVEDEAMIAVYLVEILEELGGVGQAE